MLFHDPSDVYILYECSLYLQQEHYEKVQEELEKLNDERQKLTERTADSHRLVLAIGITKRGKEKALKTTAKLLLKLDAAINECEVLGAQWVGVRRKFNELVTAAGVAKDYLPEEKRKEFKYLYGELNKMRTKWHEMVVLAKEISHVLVNGCGDSASCKQQAKDLKNYNKIG